MTLPQRRAASPHFLTVCTIRDLRPSIFQDLDGHWRGYEADLLGSFAHTLGLQLRMRIVPFEKIWLRPGPGECDIAAAGITILPERIRQGARFSRPLFRLQQCLLIRRADSDRIHALADLRGRTVGVLPGTTGEASARRHAPESTRFRLFDTEDEQLAALRAGTIDAIARGTLGNVHQARTRADLTVTALMPADEWIAFAFAADNPALRLDCDAHLKALRHSGRLADLHRRWFPDLPVPDELAPAPPATADSPPPG